MKYGSVCSGIEAATMAWHSLGWEPQFFSEIEAFPSAVLKHHYPDVPNLGDMNEFKQWPDADIDVLVGGTPCQSFSVAGLRKGLDDPRGNLALTFLAIAERYAPRWVVWENVPACCHLTEEKILAPSSEGWQNSGMGSPTGFLTLSTSEFHSGAGACSLSDVLETGEVPQRFFLSPKACRGILRRADARGKKLPLPLQRALEAVVGSEETPK